MSGGIEFMHKAIRAFESGATRNACEDKYDYEGFLSPAAVERYAEYMHKHRKQADGSLRSSDNWQKGLPQNECLKSLWRHMMDLWKHMRGITASESKEDAICAIIFNAMSMLHEEVKDKHDPSKRLMTYEDWCGELEEAQPAKVCKTCRHASTDDFDSTCAPCTSTCDDASTPSNWQPAFQEGPA